MHNFKLILAKLSFSGKLHKNQGKFYTFYPNRFEEKIARDALDKMLEISWE